MSISSSAPWLKYYGDTPQHLKYPQKTIYEMVKAAADKYPKNYAYEFMGKKTTYAEFMQKIDAVAKAYLALGIQKGDRVTICMPNCPQAGRQLLCAQPHRRRLQHDPSPVCGGRNQVLSELLAV